MLGAAADDSPGTLEALRRAVEIHPRCRPVRFNYATPFSWAGENGEAETELRSMGEDFPDDWRPLRELHALLRSQGRDEEATEPLEERFGGSPAEL